MNAVGEHIYRSHDEYLFPIQTPRPQKRENYPWESAYVGKFPRITKDYFRCQGSSRNPPKETTEKAHIFDCGGIDTHSLPLKEGKEFIYTALLDILNYIQEKTQKQVIITCGHRCPAHNIYSDKSKFNTTSKHMIGAEVDFYVKGMEWNPDGVIKLIKDYYNEHPRFRSDKRFKFQRFEKDTNVSTLPWYNKEVFVKLFKKDEGRDFDNDHRYPFIAIQLKWDRESDEPVQYNWTKAFNGYLRY
ncbi:MAG: hypothetical protein P0S96_01405 [Simkaniaceae bacterium]|nr:hypothetical protein [Candidatus Sacchlamyda saccharinae]